MRPTREWILPVVAAAALAVAFVLPAHSDETRAPRNTTVTQSSYACPSAAGTTIAGGRFASHAGAVVKATSLPDLTNVPGLSTPNAWSEATIGGSTLLVDTTDNRGAGAVGFTAQMPTAKAGGGLAVGQCPGVVQDAWYLGAGTGGKHFTALTLTNLAGSASIADVTLWGLHGKVDAVNSQGIVLKPHESRQIRLETLAAGEPELAIHVTSRRGALSVATLDTSTGQFQGTEPISTTAAPSRSQLISGITGSAGSKQLLILNPGNTTARAKVQVIGKNGALVPAGLEALRIPAGQVMALDLPATTGSDSFALRMSSDLPLSASVRMASSGKDFAYAVGGPTLDGPSIVPLSIGNLLKSASLVLAAPGGAATVTVSAFDASMAKQGSTTVSLKAGTTTALDLGQKGLFGGSGRFAYVVVSSVGNVAGSAIYTNGDGFSALPLRPVPLMTLAPDVRPGH